MRVEFDEGDPLAYVYLRDDRKDEKPKRRLEVERGVFVHLDDKNEPLGIEDTSGRVAAILRDWKRVVNKVPRVLAKEREEAARKAKEEKLAREARDPDRTKQAHR